MFCKYFLSFYRTLFFLSPFLLFYFVRFKMFLSISVFFLSVIKAIFREVMNVLKTYFNCYFLSKQLFEPSTQKIMITDKNNFDTFPIIKHDICSDYFFIFLLGFDFQTNWKLILIIERSDNNYL
jgi:hypothetical protein